MKLPHILKYVDMKADAKQIGFLIRINKNLKNDKGLFMHEYEHLKQFYFLMLVTMAILIVLMYTVYPNAVYFIGVPFLAHNVLYRFKHYRKWAEVKAFKAQLAEYDTDKTDWAANMLARHYRLDITEDEAKKLLTR